jgi:hypothetical protein
MDIIVYLPCSIQKYMASNGSIISSKYTQAQNSGGVYMPMCCCC